MPITNTQDIWNRNQVDSTHINPSIMEGERGHSSMFGKGSAVAIVRYAPTYLVQPSITGSYKIPSILTCNPGVIDASPRVNVFYQWKADGVNIEGEISQTLATTVALDSFEITCEVTALNFLGVVVGLSNGITVELIEPIINHQYMHYTLTGLNQKNQQNMFKVDTLITTGISMSQRIDMQQHVILIPTGMWVDLRNDVMSCNIASITGLGPGNGGHSHNLDIYSIWQPIPLDPQPVVINGAGSTGDMTGWTVTQGSVQSKTSAFGADSRPNNLTHFFQADVQPGLIDSIMNQVIPIDATHNTIIDAGTAMYGSSYWVDSAYNYDKVATKIECLDEFDVVLSTKTNSATYNVTYQFATWQRYFFDLDYIPVGTRKFRFTVTFDQFTPHSFTENNGYFTGLEVQLLNDA